MKKLTAIALIAGLMTAMGTMGASALTITHPNYPQSSPSSDPDCANVLGHMRSVKQAEIAAINGSQPVVLIAVCEDGTVPFRNVYGSLFVNGNAELLRLPIARNATLMSALRSRQYDQHDVVSVRFGANDSVILYVHQRDMN